MAINFDIPNKYILLSVDTSFTIQDIYNATRLFEDEIAMMSEEKIIDGFGKQSLSGGVFVGITMVLLNGWRLKYTDLAGPSITLVEILGGNLVGDADDAVAASTFVAYIVQQSTSAALLDPDITAISTQLDILIEQLENRKMIDITGADSMGWQEVIYGDGTGTSGLELRRYNLFDQNGVRINVDPTAFTGIIADRQEVP